MNSGPDPENNAKKLTIKVTVLNRIFDSTSRTKRSDH